MSRRIGAAWALTSLVLAIASASVAAPTLDLARVDLFSMKGWNSTQVSVEGLQVGMALNLADAALAAKGRKLVEVLTQSPCKPSSRSCYVAGRNGEATERHAIGVLVGGTGRIIIIDVGIPEDPATLPKTIAEHFQGMTRYFFFHYSDELRLKLLGPPDKVKKSPTTDAIQAQRYTYDRLGLVVYTARYLRRGMKRPSPPELSSIEFVMPKPRAGTGH